MHWMILPLKRYADFEGRSRRMEYWMFQLLNIIVSIVLAGPFAFAVISADLAAGGQPVDEPLAAMGALGFASIGLYGLYVLAIICPAIAVTVRRFHDRGLSGWWVLGLTLGGMIPFIGFLASIASFIITLLPGDQGTNRFGPDPKDPTNAEIFA